MSLRDTMIWEDYRNAEAGWDFKYFSPHELRVRESTVLIVHRPSLEKLSALRAHIGKPLVINSAGRSVEHNREEGGAAGSYHLCGMAFDVRLNMGTKDSTGVTRTDLEELAPLFGFNGIGTYKYFIHIDTRPMPARWRG